MKLKHIKTQVNTNTTAGKAAEKVGGLTVAQLQSALKGDQKVLKTLGSIKREGDMAKALMPAIIETMKTQIENERDWNKFLGEYVESGSKADLDIQNAQNKASLANAKYTHGKKESDEQFRAAWELEKGRHQFAIDYNRAKLFADMIVQRVNGNVQQLEQGSRLKLQQLDADQKYELQVAEHLLEYGDQADLSLIHKRNYGEANSPNLWQRVKNQIGI
jgi:hypothetical protein